LKQSLKTLDFVNNKIININLKKLKIGSLYLQLYYKQVYNIYIINIIKELQNNTFFGSVNSKH